MKYTAKGVKNDMGCNVALREAAAVGTFICLASSGQMNNNQRSLAISIRPAVSFQCSYRDSKQLHHVGSRSAANTDGPDAHVTFTVKRAASDELHLAVTCPFMSYAVV